MRQMDARLNGKPLVRNKIVLSKLQVAEDGGHEMDWYIE